MPSPTLSWRRPIRNRTVVTRQRQRRRTAQRLRRHYFQFVLARRRRPPIRPGARTYRYTITVLQDYRANRRRYSVVNKGKGCRG